jgi:hypothetical protein
VGLKTIPIISSLPISILEKLRSRDGPDPFSHNYFNILKIKVSLTFMMVSYHMRKKGQTRMGISH